MSWVLGPGAVGAGRDITGPVTITVINGSFDRLNHAIFDPTQLAEILDLAHFTGRVDLIRQVDDYITTHRSGYIVIEGEAGVGKSSLAAHLVWTRPCAYHFTSPTDSRPSKPTLGIAGNAVYEIEPLRAIGWRNLQLLGGMIRWEAL